MRLAGVDALIKETGAHASGDILAQAGSADRLRVATGWRPRFDLTSSLRDLPATLTRIGHQHDQCVPKGLVNEARRRGW